MVKRLLVLALSIVMTVGILSSCGPKTSTNESGGMVSFSYVRPVWGPATFSKNGAYEQELSKRSNAKIDVQIIPVGEYNTKIATTMASGAIPDVMWGEGPNDPLFRKAAESGQFLDISKYLDKYPNIKKVLPDYLVPRLTNEKGELFFMPNLLDPFTPFMLYYRQDWFEELGIPEPKTITELEEALEKVKAAKSDVIPLTIPSYWYGKDLAASFGAIINGWNVSDTDKNMLVPSFMTAADKNFDFWLQNLKKKNLLDKDAIVSQNQGILVDKFKAGKVAVMPYHFGEYSAIVVDTMKNDPKAKIGIIDPLSGPDGTKGGIQASFPVDRGMYISAKAKDPEGILRFLNWRFSDEGIDFYRYGIEGKTYKVIDGKKEEIPDADKEPAYQRAQREPLEFLVPIELVSPNWDDIKTGMIRQGIEDLFDNYHAKYNKYCENYITNYRDPYSPSEIETKNAGKLWEDFIVPVKGAVPINTDITDAQWVQMEEKWKEAGGSAVIEDVNKVQKVKEMPKYR